MKRLYVTEWQPNGTGSLLVVEDGQVIDGMEDAVFGVRVNREPMDEQLYLCDDFISYFGDDDAEGLTLVREIKPETAIKKIAVSPVQDGEIIENWIKSHFETGE
jgi:hypothetical protein